MTFNVETQTGKLPKHSKKDVEETPKTSLHKPSAVTRKLFPTITQAFLHQVNQNPDRLTFFSKQGNVYRGITWKEAFQDVEKVSLGLQHWHLKQGDRVAILSSTRWEWALCDMATLAAKAITIPIYGSNTAEDCLYILNHSEAKFLFVENHKQLEKILSIRDRCTHLKKIFVFDFKPTKELASDHHVLSLNALKELGNRERFQFPNRVEQNLLSSRPDDVFTICYTSGTTGQPKGVVLTFDSLTSIAEDVDATMGSEISDEDRLLSFLPLSHIFGKVESMMTYHFGWRVYYAESIDAVFQNLNEAKPTLLFAVPRIFEKASTRIQTLAEQSGWLKKNMFHWALDIGRQYYQATGLIPLHNGKTVSTSKKVPLDLQLKFQAAQRLVLNTVYQKFGGQLRYCISGGAPLASSVAEFMQIIGVRILEGYGLTETCAPVTLNPAKAPHFGTIGKLLPEVEIKLSSEGEILLKSRKVFKEYYKNPEATQEVKKDGWFYTGDIGSIDQGGYIHITDRKKDLIITSGGKNIAPQKLENALKGHKLISQSVVVGEQKPYLCVLLVLDKEELLHFGRSRALGLHSYEALLTHEGVIAHVQSLIDKVNGKLANYETIKKFALLPHELSIETGELTPSLKVKRKVVFEKYRSVIDGLYAKD